MNADGLEANSMGKMRMSTAAMPRLLVRGAAEHMHERPAQLVAGADCHMAHMGGKQRRQVVSLCGTKHFLDKVSTV